MAVGPLLGRLCARWPLRRSVLVFTILGATSAAWTLVLLWPGRAPLAVLVLLVVVLGTNGPGSMIGFDYARTWNPQERQGSASGVVNVGGFVASLLTILAIGAVLDMLTPGVDRLRPQRLQGGVLGAVRLLGDRAGRRASGTAASCGRGWRATASSSSRSTTPSGPACGARPPTAEPRSRGGGRGRRRTIIGRCTGGEETPWLADRSRRAPPSPVPPRWPVWRHATCFSASTRCCATSRCSATPATCSRRSAPSCASTWSPATTRSGRSPGTSGAGSTPRRRSRTTTSGSARTTTSSTPPATRSSTTRRSAGRCRRRNVHAGHDVDPAVGQGARRGRADGGRRSGRRRSSTSRR